MKHVAFLKILGELNDKLHSLTATKGEEYKGGEDDQIGNFRRMSVKTGLLMEQVWQVFFHKHIDAIDTFVRDKAAGKDRDRSEPIESRIDDAILYLVLLRAILRDQNPANEHWLMEANRQASAVGQGTTVVKGTVLYIGSAILNPDVMTAKATGQRQFDKVSVVHHPDSLHGVAPGAEFWWVGPRDDSLAKEFEDKCQVRGLQFYHYLKP